MVNTPQDYDRTEEELILFNLAHSGERRFFDRLRTSVGESSCPPVVGPGKGGLTSGPNRRKRPRRPHKRKERTRSIWFASDSANADFLRLSGVRHKHER